MRSFIFILISTLLLPLSATAADLPFKVSKAAPLAHLCPAGKNWCHSVQQCRPSNLECAASPAK
jgi:hypothetical protein